MNFWVVFRKGFIFEVVKLMCSSLYQTSVIGHRLWDGHQFDRFEKTLWLLICQRTMTKLRENLDLTVSM